MIKTLRITSFILAAAAVCGVVLLALWGLKGDPEIEAFLSREGVIERLKTQSQTAPEKEDTVSPLVTQAQKFALRIDPPPPPAPPTPRERPAPVETAQRETPRPPPERPVVVTPPRPVSVRFDLVATARSKTDPHRSFALVKPVTGTSEWYRQGEDIEHLVLHEVRDGSIVLYQDGREHSELFVPTPPPRVRSLLRDDDAPVAERPSGPSGITTQTAAASPTPTPTREALTNETGTIRIPREAARRIPTTSQTVDAQERIRRVTAPPPAPTPEEQQQTLDRSIASIEKIMHRDDLMSDEEGRQQEQEAWTQLLQLLQKEQAALEERLPDDRDQTDQANGEQTDAPDEHSNASSQNDQ